MSNTQQALVSLAELPRLLYTIAEALAPAEFLHRTAFWDHDRAGRTDEAQAHRRAEQLCSNARQELIALASSLEQLHQPALEPIRLREIAGLLLNQVRQTPAYIDTKRLEESADFLHHVAFTLERPDLFPDANTCSNQGDTVTITLSREEATLLSKSGPAWPWGVVSSASLDGLTWHNIIHKANSALNNSTPERRG